MAYFAFTFKLLKQTGTWLAQADPPDPGTPKQVYLVSKKIMAIGST